MLELWLLVIACSAGTHLGRALGVPLSGRINVESEIFNWVACVTYAMLAGLVSRILFVPSGMLGETLLVDRLVACGLGLAAYYASRKNLLIGVAAGGGAIMALAAFR